jgi:glycosyltransferase involved in cell wall biosynthesis
MAIKSRYAALAKRLRIRSMRKPRKLIIVSQHYPPDSSSTAEIISNIAEHLAIEVPVLVLSGTPHSATNDSISLKRPTIVEIRNWMPAKAALLRRAVAEAVFALRVFCAVLVRARGGDILLTVTAPFTTPYAVIAAAKMKRANSILIMHDLYPDALVVAGLLERNSLPARMIRGANALVFRALSAIVIIGRDTEQHLAHYGEATRGKTCFIPNWATLTADVRPKMSDNPYRRLCKGRFIVGLSGNLGFTHDPLVVFEAARLLRADPTIHFLLSGWGVGFEKLRVWQSEANLPNVTLVERVLEENLEQFLSAADLWIIPYRKNVAGVSIPSRFYNLLAVGRPVVLVSEPEAEAALTVTENDLGWVVRPGRPDELAKALSTASLLPDSSMAERAVSIAKDFSRERAMSRYASLVQGLFVELKQTEHIA